MSFARLAPRSLFCLAALASVLATRPSVADRLVPEVTAQLAGLTRVWFSQAPVDASLDRVAGAAVKDGVLMVLSTSGALAAYDGENGDLLWDRHFGGSHDLVDGPTFDADRIAVKIGTVAHILDRATGAEIALRKVDGAMSGAPVVSGDYFYASLLAGRLLGYPLEPGAGVRLTVLSPGGVVGRPVVADESVVWTTERGEVYAARMENGLPVFRFDAAAPVSGPPIADGDRLYFATQNGFVYALQSDTGRVLWRRSEVSRVTKPIVHAGDALYVAGDMPALYALNAETGALEWTVEGVGGFVSASATRVYAVAPNGALAVLDRESGQPVDSWPSGEPLSPVANSDTDRLYFVSPNGLVQCFREEELETPFFHNPPEDPAAEEPAAEAVEAAPAAEEAPAEDAFEEPAADDFDDPFAPPAGDPGANEDPFGDPFGDL